MDVWRLSLNPLMEAIVKCSYCFAPITRLKRIFTAHAQSRSHYLNAGLDFGT